MIRARVTGNTEPYTAKNTLDFIEDKFVKTNANTAHIAWSNILLHTRIIGQAIYQWQASFCQETFSHHFSHIFRHFSTFDDIQ
jgi:hypothetical protein